MNVSVNTSIDTELFVARTENNSIYTTSIDVSEKFSKRHDNVTRIIKNLINTQPDTRSMFVEDQYENRGKVYPMYKMNRDGFSLVVMSFTGPDADEWKLKYIKAFNRMEQIIRNELIAFQQQAAKMPQRGTKEFFAMALLDAQQVIEDQERQLLAAQPAIVFHQAVAVSEDTILVRDFAKLITQALRKNGFPKLTVGEKKLFDWLREKGYLIKQKSNSFNMPTQKSIDMNLFHIKETTIQGDHGSRITKTPKITGKGQEYFIDKILEIYKSGGTIDV
jgi:anti-repressor protein